MKYKRRLTLTTFLWVLQLSLFAKLHICSWNLCNFGKSKDEKELNYVSSLLKKFDLIAIQEVSASKEGPAAVDRLMKLMGEGWNCKVSDPTNGSGTERYCYIWKKSKVSLQGVPHLEKGLDEEINREPYVASFHYNDDSYTFVTIHTVPTKDKPENEIRWLYMLDNSYPNEHVIFLGDFNLTFDNKAYDELKKRKFDDAVGNQKTSLKRVPKNGEVFYRSYDHILYETDEVDVLEGGLLDFTVDFKTPKEYLQISDHAPVYMTIK